MWLHCVTLHLPSPSGESLPAESRLTKNSNHGTSLGSCATEGTPLLHNDWKKPKCLALHSVSASFRASSHLNFELHNFSNCLKYKPAWAKIKYLLWNPHFTGLLIFFSCTFCGECMNCLWQRSGSRDYDSIPEALLIWLQQDCWSHLFPGSSDDEKSAVFCSEFGFVIIFIVTTQYLPASSNSKQFRILGFFTSSVHFNTENKGSSYIYILLSWTFVLFNT